MLILRILILSWALFSVSYSTFPTSPPTTILLRFQLLKKEWLKIGSAGHLSNKTTKVTPCNKKITTVIFQLKKVVENFHSFYDSCYYSFRNSYQLLRLLLRLLLLLLQHLLLLLLQHLLLLLLQRLFLQLLLLLNFLFYFLLYSVIFSCSP